MWERISQELPIRHKGKLYGALIGFFLGLFLINFGLLKTLVLLGLTIIGYIAGSRLDSSNEELMDALDRILPSDDN